MTGTIFARFLHDFNAYIRRGNMNRRVLLLLDNFSSHKAAIQEVGGIEGLSNVRIAFLPANTTSHWQPLDQGIIASFKLFYRREWVQFMVNKAERDRDPLKTVNLLKVVNWTIKAWREVTPEAISKYWIKSTCRLGSSQESLFPPSKADIDAVRDLRMNLLRIPNLLNPLPVEEYINLQEEKVVNKVIPHEILKQLINHYTENNSVDSETEEIIPKIGYFEAIQAYDFLKLYEQQQVNGKLANIRALEQMREAACFRKSRLGTQSSLTTFFGLTSD